MLLRWTAKLTVDSIGQDLKFDEIGMPSGPNGASSVAEATRFDGVPGYLNLHLMG